MTTILTKKKDTTGAPAPGDLTNAAGGAELAVNTFDKRLYTKDAGGNVVEIGTNPTILNIDNIQIDVNTISSTNTNGNIVLAPNGTGQLVVNAGTVGAPIISPTGDSNTGIFFPAADTIAFADGGVESMRIDSSGNVGIGTNAPTGKLEVSLNTTTGAGSSAAGTVANFTGVDGTGASVYINSYGASPQLISRSALGTAASPTTLTANQGLLRILGLGYNGTAFTASRAEISFAASETWTTTANGTVMTFRTTQNGTTSSAERMRITDAGRVGIGTSTPNQQLEVSANEESIISLIATGTNGKQYNLISAAGSSGIGQGALAIFDRTSSLTRLVINSSGFVGINTTSPAQLFDVVSSGESIISLRSTSAGGRQYNLISSPTAGLGSGVFSIYDRTGNASRFIITNSGLIGVGENLNPEKRLSVYDDNASTTTTSGIVVINYNATTDSRSGITFKNFDNYGAAIWSPRTSGTLGNLVFGTNGSASTAETNVVERMRIDSSGQLIVGPFGGGGNAVIAGSSSPSFTNQPGTNLLLKSGDGSGTGSSFMSFSTSPAGSSGTTVNTAVERMRIDSSGRVGINTTSPNAKLGIESAADGSDSIRIRSAKSNGVDGLYGTIIFNSSSNPSYDAQGASISSGSFYVDAGDLRFSTSTGTGRIERMRIQTDGNVAIGVNSLNRLGSGATAPALALATTGTGAGDAPEIYLYSAATATGSTVGTLNFGTSGASSSIKRSALILSQLTSTSTTNVSGNLIFYTNAAGALTEKMRLTEDGQLLINRTTTSGGKFGVLSPSGSMAIQAGDANDPSYYGQVQIVRAGDQPDNAFHLSFIRAGAKIAGMGFLDNSSTFAIQNASNNTGNGVTLTDGATSWGTTSDERKKNIIAPVEGALTKLANWRSVYYTYKNDEKQDKKVGLIAQDVQATLPEAISVEEDEMKTLQLRYTETIPVLVKAIQELKAELDSVKTELQTLKGN